MRRKMKRRKRDGWERGRKRRTTAAFALEGQGRERDVKDGREILFFPSHKLLLHYQLLSLIPYLSFYFC